MFNEFNNKLDLSKQIDYDEFEENLQTWFFDVEQIKELNGDFILENKDRLKFKIGNWKQTNKNEWGVDYIYFYVYVFDSVASELNNSRGGALCCTKTYSICSCVKRGNDKGLWELT